MLVGPGASVMSTTAVDKLVCAALPVALSD